jgi:hypothetical protein
MDLMTVSKILGSCKQLIFKWTVWLQKGTKIFRCDMGKQSHYHRFWMVVEMKILTPLCAFQCQNKLGIELYA